jgi:glutathione S-transferase
MSALVTVFGAGYSVYVRSVRLTLAEKGIDYQLDEVDVFAPGGPPAAHLQRQPFGRIPAFEHRTSQHRTPQDSVNIYETSAILRYIDEAFPGPKLQPDDVLARARMNQVLSILDNYAYRTLVWDIYVQRVSLPAEGRATDETVITRAMPMARTCLQALAELMQDGAWLAGSALTLADLHAAPMFAYFIEAAEARDLLAPHPTLQRWWDRISRRESLRHTRVSAL